MYTSWTGVGVLLRHGRHSAKWHMGAPERPSGGERGASWPSGGVTCKRLHMASFEACGGGRQGSGRGPAGAPLRGA